MRVSRKKAVYQSGPKKGRLKPGCKYIKGDGAECKSTSKKSSRKKGGSRTKKRKATGAAKRARKGVGPRTPRMDRLNAWRRAFKSAGTCQQKREALRALKTQFQHMAAQPAKTKRGESQGQAASRRWSKWQSEYRNKVEETEAFCSGRPRKSMRYVGPGMVNGLSGSKRGGKKKHPCATANPPAWCGR